MIIIVDRFVHGYLHVLANVNLIKILNLIFPDDSKMFVAEEEHLGLVRAHQDLQQIANLSYKPCHNKKLKNGFIFQVLRVFSRCLNDFKFFSELFKSIPPGSDSLIFLTHIYPLSLISIKLLKRKFPHVKIILTMHGEVEYIFFYKSVYQLFIGWIYRFIFWLDAGNMWYLFLTKVSTGIMVKSKKLKTDETMSIILPTLNREVSDYREHELLATGPVKIGHIGSAGKRKNVDQFYELAKGFETHIACEYLKLSVVGPIERNLSPYLNDLIENYVDNIIDRPLPRNRFDIETESLDYSIFFYGRNDFVLRSSAAFYDAVFFEKPMIVLKNDFFIDVFSECGDLGYICDDIADMKKVIRHIIENREAAKLEYRRIKNNIKLYKARLDLKVVADDLKSQMIKLGLLRF